MKKIFIQLNERGGINRSVDAQYDEDNNVIPMENYDGPFEVADDFGNNDELAYYRKNGDRLKKDNGAFEQYQIEQRIVANEEGCARRIHAAETRLREIQAQAVAQSVTNADDIIAISPLLPEWTTAIYHVGDVVTHNGVPYKCIQERDCAAHPALPPASDPVGWTNYHAREEAFALPWIQPTGVHDAYNTGERMIWTDGKAYRSKADTTIYPPDVLPQAWEN